MTAIAYRAGILAADTAGWSGGGHVKVPTPLKIVRLSDGGLVAACGAAEDCVWISGWLNSNRVSPQVTIHREDGFDAIWIKPDGSIWRCSDRLEFYESPAEFHALGAATTFMYGALHAGATAFMAVQLAIDHTDGAGGYVQVEHLQPVMKDAAQ